MKKLKQYLNLSTFLTAVFLFTSVTIHYFTLLVLISQFIPVSLGQSYQITIVDDSGLIVSNTLFGTPGTYLALDQIPPALQHAFIAIEDQGFYRHAGFELPRILKAAATNVQSGEYAEGGSTITQQLARTLYLNNNKTITRKIEEFFYALSLEQHYSKAKLLEAYLNVIFLGHGKYGVDQAAHYYFNQDVPSLSIAQAALLAGLASSPTNLSPVYHPERAKERQMVVLLKMYEQGYLTADEYIAATKEPLVYDFSQTADPTSALQYYFDTILETLDALGLLEKRHLTRGITIKTHLDAHLTLQLQALLNKYPKPKGSEVALVVMKPYSNEVVSVIGGSNYQETQFNRAIHTARPIGSLIKPLIYYLALSKGMTPSDAFISAPGSYLIKGYGNLAIDNPGDRYANRPINMIEALGTSDNAYAVKSMLLVGSHNIAAALDKFTAEPVADSPTLAYGSAALTPLEVASLYNTLASEGEYYQPRLIEKVTDGLGITLYESKAQKVSLLDPSRTIMLNQLLTAPFDQNLAKSAYTAPTLVNYQPATPFSAKTGTTMSAQWIAAFNPCYTFVLYVGTDDFSALEETAYSRLIFKAASSLLASTSEAYWYAPTNRLTSRRVEPVSLNADPQGSLYYFPYYY